MRLRANYACNFVTVIFVHAFSARSTWCCADGLHCAVCRSGARTCGRCAGAAEARRKVESIYQSELQGGKQTRTIVLKSRRPTILYVSHRAMMCMCMLLHDNFIEPTQVRPTPLVVAVQRFHVDTVAALLEDDALVNVEWVSVTAS